MYPDKQPSDASGAANLFGNLPPGVPGAGAAWTGNDTQAGTTAQVPNAADAPEPTDHFFDATSMSLNHAAQALDANHAAMSTENLSMGNGAGHQADNFEHITHPNHFDYIPESNNFELPESNHFQLPHSNNLDLPRPNISDLPHPDKFLWLLDYNGDDEPIVDDKDFKLPHPDEFERALLEDLGELPEDVGSAFPAQQQLDEQPQQLLQPNVQQQQPQPNVQQQQPQPNVQQQQPQSILDKKIKLLKDLTELLETRHTVSPAQLEESINQLLGSQQSASPAPFQENSTQLLEPQQSASPAQLQQSALPAMAQPIQQQQQQSRASLSPQRLPDLDAMLEKFSIITDNFKEVHARTCECVGGVNMRVAQGSSREQELATFQVDNQVHRWVNHWVKEDAKNPWAPILRDTPPVPSANANANANFNFNEFLNSYNRSFSWLYWRAMSASSGLKRILQGLPHEWIFGKGPDAVPEELRQAVIECHTLSLNTFNALLAFMEHDKNLLPFRFTFNGYFDVLRVINQTQGQGAQNAHQTQGQGAQNANQNQGQGAQPSAAIRYLTEKCHERILAQSRYVHSLLRDLFPYPVLPGLQQVQAITDDQLQMLLQQQQEAARDYPMLRVCPFVTGPNTNNDQIKTLEFCVFYRLNFILQRLPRM
ncbi:hypothetical protein T069G_01635 [Trichoderma breve]|uniref:Uncharacterized protein n=1 Tax=Trichoderma breve TaxID=2034170 RepID=A0A9W9EE95_9HYPO|nr:hypothetical protein T069G_01635 [Trichoderma breve]KAJ4865105.1 hypothetical protein T069G_01635 [Trichoderma breve]